MKNIRTTLILIPVLFFAHCVKNEIEPKSASYFPLAVGNFWIYEKVERLSPDTPNQPLEINISLDTFSIG